MNIWVVSSILFAWTILLKNISEHVIMHHVHTCKTVMMTYTWKVGAQNHWIFMDLVPKSFLKWLYQFILQLSHSSAFYKLWIMTLLIHWNDYHEAPQWPTYCQIQWPSFYSHFTQFFKVFNRNNYSKYVFPMTFWLSKRLPWPFIALVFFLSH